MLLNEILHKVEKSRRDFILLKLDTIKAFNYMGWEFLIKLLEKIGFKPYFINMVVATNSTTTSVVLI